jgi:nicotinic acid mononucleotide adenylyltransferase
MAARFPGAEIWHVVGADLVAGGRRGESEIQRTWTKGAAIWNDLRYAVLTRSGYGMSIEDLPPRSMLVDVSDLIGSSSLIRQRLARGEPTGGLLDPAVEAEVREQGLYQA